MNYLFRSYFILFPFDYDIAHCGYYIYHHQNNITPFL
jgi:hypothetical protein